MQNDNGTAVVPETNDVGGDLPSWLDSWALNLPRWRDPVTELDTRCYEICRTTDAVANPMNKLAGRVASHQLTVAGPDGPRKEALQRIVDLMPKMPETISALMWAYAEGVIFGWLRIWRHIDGYAIPAISVRRKVTAGGTFVWDGERVVKRQEFGYGVVVSANDAQAMDLPRDRVLVFVPGNTGHPEGDLDLAWRLYLIAEAAQHNERSSWKYAHRHSLPWDIFHAAVGKATPSAARARIDSSANKMAALNAKQTSMGVQRDDIIGLIEPRGTTANFLDQRATRIEQRAELALLRNVLTSRTADSGPTGSSVIHKGEQDAAESSAAKSLAEPFSNDLLPYIETRNADLLPPDHAGEHWIELTPQPPPKDTAKASDVISAWNSHLPQDANTVYGVLGQPVPADTPEVLVKEMPAFDPFGGGLFGSDDDEDEDADDDPPSKKSMRSVRRAARIRAWRREQQRRVLAVHTKAAKGVQREAIGLARVIAKSLDAALDLFAEGAMFNADRFSGTDAARGLFADVIDTHATGHLHGSDEVLAEVNTLIGKAKRATRGRLDREKRDAADDAELLRLAELYLQDAEDAVKLAAGTMQDKVKAKLAAFIADGGTLGDTDGFVSWIRTEAPEITEAYAKLMVRNALAKAYSRGRLEQYRTLAEPLGYSRKINDAGDDTVRDDHRAWGRNPGAIIPPGAAYDRMLPPFDHNCRCTWTLTDEDPWDDAQLLALPLLPFQQ